MPLAITLFKQNEYFKERNNFQYFSALSDITIKRKKSSLDTLKHNVKILLIV